jgi:uncharacterized protein YbbC (DUF1343 family)
MTRRQLLALASGGLSASLSSCINPGGPSPMPGGAPSAGGPFALGIDMLRETGYAQLRGKRIGLITNQTSADRSGTPTRVMLQRALGPAFTTLYTPEHGLDGREPAGLHVSSRRDPVTGLTAHSLYGATRKPTPAMLANVDAVCFDLQDIGSRSYTYISTMALAMEACAQAGKEFIVLDRPNPIGGLRVQGPHLEPRWKSFVGQIPVPYLHGMTAGELARMGNARGWWAARPQLTVIPMRGWTRGMAWHDTHLRWIPTSPNIPSAHSPIYYAATGILGGLDGVDIGIGTPHPFEYAGGKGINPQQFADDMNRRGIPDVRFIPYNSSRKPGFGGVKLQIALHGSTDIMALAVVLCSEVIRRSGGHPLRATRGDTLSLFHKVWGSESLWNTLRSGQSPSGLIASFQSSARSFAALRQPFLMYA